MINVDKYEGTRLLTCALIFLLPLISMANGLSSSSRGMNRPSVEAVISAKLMKEARTKKRSVFDFVYNPELTPTTQNAQGNRRRKGEHGPQPIDPIKVRYRRVISSLWTCFSPPYQLLRAYQQHHRHWHCV